MDSNLLLKVVRVSLKLVVARVLTINACTTTDIEISIYATYRDWETDRKSTRLNSSH